MKRSQLKRKGRRKLSPEEQAAREEFRASVRYLPCLVCNERKPDYEMDPHHVIYEQHLAPEHKWDPRNAMPVCRDCHAAHHSGAKRISSRLIGVLTWVFAREVLQGNAEDYVRRYYA